jgi:hypothetical protein
MQVTITHSGVANNVQVSASVEGIVNVVSVLPMVVELQLFRDGLNGKSAYELGLENGFMGSELEWAQTLTREVLDGGIIF